MEAQQQSPSECADLAEVLRTAIEPGLQLLPAPLRSDEARVLMLAAGLQESNLLTRAQKVAGNPYAKGPARGLWQNERGGVQCVITNIGTRDLAAGLCAARGVPIDASLIHARLEFDDVLAAGFARLFLYDDPKPLPTCGDADGAWRMYLRCWRPGRPRPERWPANHKAALVAVVPPAA